MEVTYATKNGVCTVVYSDNNKGIGINIKAANSYNNLYTKYGQWTTQNLNNNPFNVTNV